MSWTRDGRRVACQAGGLAVATPGGPTRKVVSTGTRFAIESSWSPNRRELAYVVDSSPYVDDRYQLRIYNFATRRSRRVVLPRALTKLAQPAWSPDGRMIGFAASGRCRRRVCIYAVYVNDVAARRTRRVATEGQAPAWST